MSITIVPVQIRDHYTIMNDLMRELHISEKMFFAQTADWDSISGDYLDHVIEMQENYDGTCLMAYVDGVPAGFIFAYIEEPDESRIEAYTGNTLYVSDGYVQPTFRRQGIYRMMNDELEKIYLAKGVRRIVRYTLTNNHRMQEFLASKEYTAVRIVYEKWLDEDGTKTIDLGLQPKQ
ncbi:GNAT family N-acetyltransferase [Chitinophaga silvatica]|uniref:GNAT family N-acetyltransferase n=1 Tax=Chitinophaga silvatica TaxID=2282649 RepID=A0A3E1YE02_9BACT|nr:GNAT family N-acetyltransferase [Chitinophaga silvatica]RFS24683.1 GNAT family N-acetyltransferase [Chitinophaga silvatica]